MKTKEQRYDEAVERNISNLERRGTYKDNIWDIRNAAGIRKCDSRYDDRINKIIKQANTKKGK